MSQENHVSQHEKFVLLGKAEAPEIYVEGMTHIQLGAPITKIVFHTLIEPAQAAGGQEVRRAAVNLNVPTHVLIDMARQILAVCKNSEEILTSIGETNLQTIRTLLREVPEMSMPDGIEDSSPRSKAKPR